MPGQIFPEQSTRVTIDAMLAASGWRVLGLGGLNLHAALGVAVREMQWQAVGVVEVRKVGTALIGRGQAHSFSRRPNQTQPSDHQRVRTLHHPGRPLQYNEFDEEAVTEAPLDFKPMQDRSICSANRLN